MGGFGGRIQKCMHSTTPKSQTHVTHMLALTLQGLKVTHFFIILHFPLTATPVGKCVLVRTSI